MKQLLSIAIATLSLMGSLEAVTVYEDGEGGTTDKWRVRSEPAVITNVFSNARGNRAIRITGGGSVIIGAISGENAWNNTEEKTISWKMHVSNRYTVYVVVNTTHGTRYLFYNDLPQRILRHGTLGGILHGLGGYQHDEYKGVWRTYTRDLEADLKDSEPDNEIISVNGLIYNGSSASIDDIMLYNPQERGYGATAAAWHISDNNPAGARVQSIMDPEPNHARGNVIQLQGAGVNNAYMLGNPTGQGAWNNRESRILQWKSRFHEYYEVRVGIETTQGMRTMLYVNRDTYTPSGGLQDNGMTIWHDLGGWSIIGHNGWEQRRDFGAVNNNWQTITRDIQEDLSNFERGNELIAVNSFEVRGSGLIDEIKMLSSAVASDVPIAGESYTYEDAEDGNTNGWRIFANNPAGATITNVEDPQRGGRVILLQGSGRSNGYMLGSRRGEGAWGDSDKKIVRWSMNYDESFTVYISTETTNGRRYFTYTPRDENLGLSGSYVRLGLGAEADNGTWQTFTRDLTADLHLFEPDNDILTINAFMIRGSGRVDDIMTLSSIEEPLNRDIVYEDAEDQTSEGWSIFSNSSGEATIQNVWDEALQSRVIALEGVGKGDGYMLGNRRGEGAWNDQQHHALRWRMNYSEPFTIYVSLETTNGRRYLTYSEREVNLGRSGSYIRIGLGSDMMDGTWQQVSRDLAADLTAYEAGNEIVSINAFMVRGSGRFDDIEAYNP